LASTTNEPKEIEKLMLKVQIKISPTTIIEVDGENTRELVTRVAHLQEIFSFSKCGLCGGPVRYVTRTAQNFVFYEVKCTDIRRCGAALKLGQPKANPDWLFPSRKDQNGNWLPNDGWTIYQKGQNEQSQAQHAPTDDQYQQQDGPQYEA
jgi:hypothetical protein